MALCQLKKNLMSYKRSHCNWKGSNLIVNVLVMAQDTGISAHTASSEQRTLTEKTLVLQVSFLLLRDSKRKKSLLRCLKAFLLYSSLLSPKSFWTDLALNPPKAGVYSNSSSRSCNRERESPNIPPPQHALPFAPDSALGAALNLSLQVNTAPSRRDICWDISFHHTFFLLLFPASFPLSAPHLFLPCLQPTK